MDILTKPDISYYKITKTVLKVGGCAIIIYMSPPVVLTVIKWFPWFYSGWRIYYKLQKVVDLRFSRFGGLANYIYSKFKKKSEEVEMDVLETPSEK